MAKKINLTTTAKRLEVYYDGHCGMCCTFVEWLMKQERAMDVKCLPYQSDEAQARFPELLELKPDKEMITRVDGEDHFRGAEGWLWCLWSCAKYRDVASKLNNRIMLPLAQKTCYLMSKNRLRVSKLFFGKKSREVSKEIHELSQSEGITKQCDDGNCKL